MGKMISNEQEFSLWNEYVWNEQEGPEILHRLKVEIYVLLHILTRNCFTHLGLLIRSNGKAEAHHQGNQDTNFIRTIFAEINTSNQDEMRIMSIEELNDTQAKTQKAFDQKKWDCWRETDRNLKVESIQSR